MGGRRLVFAAIGTVLLLWLLRTASPPRPLFPIHEPRPPADFGVEFDRTKCGTIRGTVLWSGPVPAVEPIELRSARTPPGREAHVPNPNAPAVKDGRLANALVYLTHVDLRRCVRPSFSPVTVEVSRAGMIVKQGEHTGRVGAVYRGDAVHLVPTESTDPATNLPAMHSIRGRGASFFTQALPVPSQPVARVLRERGIVELSSGSGYYWLRAHLFVSDHPYAAISGPDGAFELKDVPDGTYELVCWLPNWHIDHFENDPELSVYAGPARMIFRPTVDKRATVAVKAGRVADVSFTLSTADFDR